MSLLVLAAATVVEHAPGAHAAGGGNPAELLTQFGVELKYVIWQLVSFTIMAFVLYRWAIKPVIATMDERNAKIESGLKNAEATAVRLAEAQTQAAALVKEAQLQANKIVEEARKTSKEFSERESAAATERANALITKAQQAIALEHKQMLNEARGEIARLVVTTTERVLAKKLSDADRASYNEAAAKELSGV
ncbi:MAG: F0F1 ATP synthase subunit B [Opitutaceae bacterium]|nr:F0F1 ATP synthase subunit B [Opitutaceae bacterium]